MPQYQGVWTLEAQAQAQSNQQWVTDPNFKNTTLLLQADGTGSGSQNQTFLDGSTNNFFITRNGNTTQGSFSPFSQAPGYWSNYFNGSSYLSIANDANLNLGSSNFTIEFWVYAPSSTGPNAIISKGNTSSLGSDAWSVEWTNTTGTLGYGNGAFNSWASPIVTGTVTLNAWNHVAVVRNGTTHTLYINGTSASTATASYTVTSAGPLYIGTGWYAPSSRYFLGYVSNARIVIGSAVYTSNFAPSTTPLTAITNTQLLTCQNNRFLDNSTNGYAISVTSSPSVQAFGPFAPALQWTPDVVGGSGYFDGSGDYLSFSGMNVGSNTFTFETWAYFNSTGNYQTLINGGFRLLAFSGNTTTIGTDNWGVGGGSNFTVPALAANTWYHIAYVKNGTTGRLYLNGVESSTGGVSDTNTYGSGATTYFIGATSGPQYYITGYMCGTRMVIGTAVYTSAFTPPTAPPTAVTNTALLLNYTNAGIYDGAMDNVLETVGSAQVATSPVKYGSGSMYFGGTGTYPSYTTSNLVGPANAGLYNFGTSNFTIEAWINLSVTTTARVIVSSGYNADTGGGGWTFTYRGDISSLSLSVNANVVYSKSWSPSANIWYHVAVTRAENILRFFVDGVQIGTTSTSTDNITGSSTIVVGGNSGGANLNFLGYIDDLRITRVARYLANFTPPQQALPRQ
jgi:hypothetical protein